MKHTHLYLLVLILFLTGCQQSRLKKVVNVPEPDDLVAYFAIEEKETIGILYHSDIEETQKVRRSIELLQEYGSGQSNQYPAWIVKEAIGIMITEIKYVESHGDFSSVKEMEHMLGYIYSYMDQAFRLCPDISLLTDHYSSDKQIGILSFSGWSYNHPMLCFLIYPNYKGGFRITLWSMEEEPFSKIYPVEKDGKQYYLLTGIGYVYNPVVSLISFNEKGITEHLLPLKKEVKDFLYCWEQGEEIIFNPRELTWKRCRENSNGYWVQIDNTPTAQLIWGKKSRIILQ